MFRQGDGSLIAMPSSASVTWSGPPLVVATDGSADAGDPIPVPGAMPTAFWLQNPTHYSDAELSGVLFITDPGTVSGGAISVVADVSGSLTAHLTASIAVSSVPTGDPTNGATLYAAQCASCHGATGHGTANGPGINAESGNVASDPTWNSGLMGSVVRGDIDNQGVALAAAMPEWLEMPVTSQDFIDAYAWLRTQTQ
jgi:mono/diheme cytochrome c family protein